MTSGGLRRRHLIAGGLATGTLAAPLAARAQSGFNWRKYSGQTLEVAMQRIEFCSLLQQHEREFEDLTGITVHSEQVPEQQFRQKLVIDFASGTPGIDVCFLAYTSQKQLFGRAKWLADLRPFIADPNLTPDDFDFADFTSPSIAAATQDDGRLDTLPIAFAYNIILWNKAMFAAKSLAPPQTFAELLHAARTLHDPKNGVSGFVTRGAKAANVIMWTSFLLGYGLDAVDAQGQLHTDGAEAIASAQLYQTLDREYGPPGVIGFNWNESLTTFMLGRAAMFLDTTTVCQAASDPTRSKVADKVGYSVMPAGPKARVAPSFGDGFGVTSASERKGAAWLYCQWATGKVNQARQLIGGYGDSTRKSAYAAIAAATNVKAPPEWLEVNARSAPIARPALPQIVAIAEFRDIYGAALTNLLGDGDAPTELRQATKAFRPVLARTEKT